MPESVVVSCHGDEGRGVRPGEVAFRLHFEAEHSNVLVVTAELLTGCLTPVEVISVVRMGLVTEHTPDGPQLVREGMERLILCTCAMFKKNYCIHQCSVCCRKFTAFVCVLV